MNICNDMDVNSKYILDQAIKDGVLVEIFKHRWDELSAGKPIVATRYRYFIPLVLILLANLSCRPRQKQWYRSTRRACVDPSENRTLMLLAFC